MGVAKEIKLGHLLAARRNHSGWCGPLRLPNHTAEGVRVKARTKEGTLMIVVTHRSDALESSSTKTTPSVRS